MIADRLTDADLELIASVRDIDPARLRAHRELAQSLLTDERVADAVLRRGRDPLLVASPYLLFAVLVSRVARDLRDARYVEEWVAPRRRVPVFDVDPLRRFLADPDHRLFLVDLLASYTHVSSGVVPVRTPRGLRRRRWSELDLVRLAELLELVPAGERPNVYRRLGDLALFLTGVFPDHAELRAIDAARLSRSAGVRDVSLLSELGERWYRLAGFELQFADARRVLTVLTDRYLFPRRESWFPSR